MYTRLLWCYPEGPQQAEELSRDETCEAQQGEMPSLALGNNNPMPCTDQGLSSWKAALQRRIWGSW